MPFNAAELIFNQGKKYFAEHKEELLHALWDQVVQFFRGLDANKNNQADMDEIMAHLKAAYELGVKNIQQNAGVEKDDKQI